MNRRNFIALPLGFMGLGTKKAEPDLRCDFWVKGVHYAMGLTLNGAYDTQEKKWVPNPDWLDGDKWNRKMVAALFKSGERSAIGEMVKQGTLERQPTDIVPD